MADRYAELRAALEMGPTPGPWFVHGSQGYAVATVGKIRIAADEFHIKTRPGDDAAYIAACHPEVIRALLAERDALRVALEDELIWHEARYKVLSKQPDANTGHTWWRRMQHQEHAAAIRAALEHGQGGGDADRHTD